jgi:hypothetical protein
MSLTVKASEPVMNIFLSIPASLRTHPVNYQWGEGTGGSGAAARTRSAGTKLDFANMGCWEKSQLP